MPAIDFPNSPAVNDTFTVGSITWKWDGATWQSQGISVAGPAGPAGANGTNGTNGTNGAPGAPGEANFSSFMMMGA
jgi:hypothetical protein